MMAKRFALGVGIAIILPMMIHYGVSTVTPSPKWQDYEIKNYYERHSRATDEGKANLEREKNRLQEQRRLASKRFERTLFFVSIPLGIAAIIFGSASVIPGVSAGLMFGGIFSVVDGYVLYWAELPDALRFVSLLAAFVVLMVIGYRKMGKQ